MLRENYQRNAKPKISCALPKESLKATSKEKKKPANLSLALRSLQFISTVEH